MTGRPARPSGERARILVASVAPADLVSTAVGILLATGIVGGAAPRWLVGVSAQRVGLWSLLAWAAASAVVLGAIWWRISRQLAEGVRA